MDPDSEILNESDPETIRIRYTLCVQTTVCELEVTVKKREDLTGFNFSPEDSHFFNPQHWQHVWGHSKNNKVVWNRSGSNFSGGWIRIHIFLIYNIGLIAMPDVTVKIAKWVETDPDPIFSVGWIRIHIFLIHNIGLIAMPDVTVKIIKWVGTDPDSIFLWRLKPDPHFINQRNWLELKAISHVWYHSKKTDDLKLMRFYSGGWKRSRAFFLIKNKWFRWWLCLRSQMMFSFLAILPGTKGI